MLNNGQSCKVDALGALNSNVSFWSVLQEAWLPSEQPLPQRYLISSHNNGIVFNEQASTVAHMRIPTLFPVSITLSTSRRIGTVVSAKWVPRAITSRLYMERR